MVELIAATTTKTGLKVRCELDTKTYPKGIKVSDAEMATLNIKGDAFHPEWNLHHLAALTQAHNMKHLFRCVA